MDQRGRWAIAGLVLAVGGALLLWWIGQSGTDLADAPTATVAAEPAAAPLPSAEPAPLEPAEPAGTRRDPTERLETPAPDATSDSASVDSAAPSAAPSTTGGELIGTVVDDAGQPVVQAHVKIGESSSAVINTGAEHIARTTNARGEFVIPAPPDSGYWIRVVAVGFPTHLAGAPDVHVRPYDPPPRIVLSAGGWIVGRVVLRDSGAPAKDHALTLMPAPNPDQWASMFMSRAPDGDTLEPGEIRSPRIYPGRYWLQVDGNDVLPARVEVLVVAGQPVDVGTIELGTGGRVVGRVRAPDGEPIGTVMLSMQPRGEYRIGAWTGRATVREFEASEATFEIVGVPDGEYQIRVLAARWRSLRVSDVAVKGAATVDVAITLESGAFVVLRVLGKADAPQPGVNVRIGQSGDAWETGGMFEAPNSYSLKTLTTDAHGRCETGALVPGRWPVEVELRDAQGASTWVRVGEVDLAPGTNGERELRLPR